MGSVVIHQAYQEIHHFKNLSANGQLQTIESNLAFATQGLLKRVRWDNPQKEYIPESDEERELIAIRNISTNKKYPQPEANVTPNLLIGLVKLSSNYESIALAKAFWREGMVYHENLQYVQAFYQFYFILAGCRRD